MDTQLSALLMFLLLTYLLFRRPASASSKRYPTELNFQVGHTIYMTSEILKKKTVSPRRQRGVNRPLLRGGALVLALVLPSGAVAMAQSPTGSQVQLADAGNVSKAGKKIKKKAARRMTGLRTVGTTRN